MAGIFNELDRDDQKPLQGLGLTVREMRAVARRQLGGGLVAGILIVAIAALVSIGSNSPAPLTTAHNGVRQPILVAPPDHVVAAIKGKIEAP